jgi:acyl carrier protein
LSEEVGGMTTTQETLDTVRSAVAEALGLDEDEVTPDSTLFGDLGAESIDLLDILFRIERATGVKIQASDLNAYVQGGIPDDEFGDENNIVTPKGMEQLKKVMPQLDSDQLAGNLRGEDVMSHFTVQNLADMVQQHAGAAGS